MFIGKNASKYLFMEPNPYRTRYASLQINYG